LVGENYIAQDPPNVSFKVKSKALGILDFGPSTVDYNQFMGGSITKYIGTPTFNCTSGIEHGVFKKFDSTTGKAIFAEDGLFFAKGAKLQFGANINILNTDAIELTVDSNCTMNSMPSVFKIEGDKLGELGKMTGSDKTYTYDNTTGYIGKVVVLYNVTLNHIQDQETCQYTNIIKYGQQVSTNVNTSDNKSLPDLF
jgi:hypothetical protein